MTNNAKSDVTAKNPLMRAFQRFAKLEAASGILLLIASAAAIILANSAYSTQYHHLWEINAGLSIYGFAVRHSLHFWINDALMALFFFLVGLEIKRELLIGELSSLKKASLPIVAALGGMAVPAAIFLALNYGSAAQHGWGIPVATDIAFALGALALAGPRVPSGLKIFLSALAIADDIGAVLVIALFYTAAVSFHYLAYAAVLCSLMALLNASGKRSTVIYILFGGVLWALFHRSGVHATIAGVVAAALIPASSLDTSVDSPLERYEHALQPWISFGIMPLFAFANAGVTLSLVSDNPIRDPVVLGVFFGLLIGKQIGIFGFSWLAVKLRLAALPQGVFWRHVYGAALLGAIGFTMSLFVAELCFRGSQELDQAKIGVLAASLAAGIFGILFLRLTTTKTAKI